jgi:hypothetical protein
MRNIAAAAAAALVMMPAAGSAMTLLIDDFITPQRVADQPDGTDPSQSELATLTSLGGWRDMWVETDLAGVADTTFQSNSGFLAFSNVTNATGRALLTYDGNDVDPFVVDTDGLGGVDFLAVGPQPFFSFDVESFESNLFFEVRVWDMLGNTGLYNEILPPAGSFSPDLPLSDFTLDAGFDWTQVGALQFFVESSTNGYDGSIGSITLNSTIPLPASALLLLSGVGMLAYRRLRA